MKYFGVALMALALVAGILPQFTECSGLLQLANGKTTFMKCHWTAQAEIAVGVPLFAVGVMMIFSRRRETFRALSITGVVLGILVFLVPAYLIGVCDTPTMICHTTMKPALTAVGGLVMLMSLSGTAFLFGKKE